MLEHLIFLQRTLNLGKLINLKYNLKYLTKYQNVTLGLCFQSMKKFF